MLSLIILCRATLVIWYSRELRLGEVHLRMSLHELVEHLPLLQLVSGGQSHRLLSLVKHHLLDCLTSLSIEIGELAILRTEFEYPYASGNQSKDA